ncbi:hypothetical protein BV898_16333 [Hypsibius exemplaris]|uniref:Uncharacterized protein n=1 Tax=Hypsibius exemplaris TaxID=2072580 RepID=A0A9X6NFR6_HYPEX|nr:hypothetical protein BV898_16333 [Hypsibius exemplaris]
MYHQLASMVAAVKLLSLLLLILPYGTLGQVPPSWMRSTGNSSRESSITVRQRKLRFLLELGLNFGMTPIAVNANRMTPFAVNANRMTTSDVRREIYLPDPEEFQQLRLARRKFGFGLGKRTLRVVRPS